MDNTTLCLIVGFGQLLFHVARTWHIKAISSHSPATVFLTATLYQTTVIATFALGIDAYLSQEWGVVLAFIIGGAVGSTITTKQKP